MHNFLLYTSTIYGTQKTSDANYCERNFEFSGIYIFVECVDYTESKSIIID